MGQIDKDRFLNMASCYDRMAPYLVPRYEWLQDQAIDLLSPDRIGARLVVDLGAGSGIFLERLLSRQPGSRGVWVDSSPDFESVARRRLAAFGPRVQFVRRRLEDAWEADLSDTPAAICSMSAIHHLESGQKRRLYERCHNVLEPGGRFLNIDEVRAPDDDAYLNTLRYWVDYVDRAAASVPAELAGECHAWCEKFDGWKKRNIENRDQPKLPGDDIHEGFNEQLQWLRAAGFIEVDLPVKFQLWCIMGGRKPS